MQDSSLTCMRKSLRGPAFFPAWVFCANAGSDPRAVEIMFIRPLGMRSQSGYGTGRIGTGRDKTFLCPICVSEILAAWAHRSTLTTIGPYSL